MPNLRHGNCENSILHYKTLPPLRSDEAQPCHRPVVLSYQRLCPKKTAGSVVITMFPDLSHRFFPFVASSKEFSAVAKGM